MNEDDDWAPVPDKIIPSEREAEMAFSDEWEDLDAAAASAESDHQCSYVQQLDDKEWHCHRVVDEGNEYCLFHRPIPEKDDNNVTDAFREAIQEPGIRAKQFVGAKFGNLQMQFTTLDGPDNYPIDIRHAEVQGDLIFANTSFGQPIFADHLTVTGKAAFAESTFEHVALFQNAEFGKATFSYCTFLGLTVFDGVETESELGFGDASFESVLRLNNVTVGDTLNCTGVTSESKIRLQDANIKGTATFRRMNLKDYLYAKEIHVTGDVILRKATVDATLYISEGTIGGTFSLSHAVLRRNVLLTEMDISGGLDLSLSEFSSHVYVRDVNIEGDVDANSATFRKTFKFLEIHTSGSTDFSHAQFSDMVFVSESTFGGLGFETATFDGNAAFEDVTINGDTDFKLAEFGRELILSDTKIAGNPDFSQTHIEDGHFEILPTDEPTTVGLDDAIIRSGKITLPNSTMVGYDCTGATIGDVELQFSGDPRLGSSDNDRAPLFNHFRFKNTTFDEFDFGDYKHELAAVDWTLHETAEKLNFDSVEDWLQKHTEFIYGLESNMNLYVMMTVTMLRGILVYDLSPRETVDLVGNLSSLADNGEFEKASSIDGLKNNLANEDPTSEWQSIEDPTSEWHSHSDLENTYLKAKNGADDVGDRKSAAEFFINEMVYRRKKNLALVVQPSSKEGGIRTRFRALSRWIGNYLLNFSCGYGERLSRVIYASSVVVAVWTLLYMFLSQGTTDGTSGLTTEGIDSLAQLATPEGIAILKSNLYFSIVTFTTLGYGDIQPVGTTARYLAGFESLLGALLVALLVFVLGRRVAW